MQPLFPESEAQHIPKMDCGLISFLQNKGWSDNGPANEKVTVNRAAGHVSSARPSHFCLSLRARPMPGPRKATAPELGHSNCKILNMGCYFSHLFLASI